MSTASGSQGQENTYVINAESAAEMNRLIVQDSMLTQQMGGLFPEIADLANVHDVLDIACGPGQWVLDMAYTYQHMQVTGIDISEKMILHANSRKFPHTTFRVMDILQTLDFPDNSFDIVNARLLFGVLPKTAWPVLMQECMRITRPGGTIRLTECETPMTNNSIYEKFPAMLARALYLSGHSFSPDGRQIGITPMLGGFLQNVGYQDIHHRAFVIDFSKNADGHSYMVENVTLSFLLLQPFFIKMGVATKEELQHIYDGILKEMQEPNFRALWPYLVVWGRKP